MQVGDLDNAHKGKMEHYLEALIHANPDRHFAKGAVFNGSEFVMYLVAKEGTGNDLNFKESPVLSLGTCEAHDLPGSVHFGSIQQP